jgi:hypothetical protein
MQKITIPDSVDFADLKLARDPDGHVSFDWRPIEAICLASDLNVAVFRDAHEDNVAALLVAWYGEHIANGGARDAVQDDLIAETIYEDLHGDRTSHAPGRA